MNNKIAYILLAAAALGTSPSLQAQTKDIYLDPSAKMMTHPNAEMAVFGDIINDAQAGIDHNSGGTVTLYRTAAQSSDATRVYDGPLAPTPTDAQNTNGAYLRFWTLKTDNTTGAAVPSGTGINSNSGSGDINIEQEVRVTNQHDFVNGTVWTPRDLWKHAFVHYESVATYSGVATNNFSGPHIDGYAAYSGDSDFMFPIGDGITARMAGVSTPDLGFYKGAYFKTNPQAGSTGISGSSTGTSFATSDILAVSQSEFWDIDGTALTYITLTADNTVQNTSKWSTDFANHPISTTSEIGITGWDDWEYLGNQSPPTSMTADGQYTTTAKVHPDAGGVNGSPYAAFTWAAALSTNLAVDELTLAVISQDCDAFVTLTTLNEEDARIAHIMRTDEDGLSIEVGQIELEGNTNHRNTYSILDQELIPNEMYIYTARIEYEDGSYENSSSVGYKSHCSKQIKWTLYPNPTAGDIVLESNIPVEASRLRVHDITGRLVMDRDISSTQDKSYEVSLQGNSDGLYVISLLDDDDLNIYQHVVNLKTN